MISPESCSGHHDTQACDQREATYGSTTQYREWGTKPQKYLRDEAATEKQALFKGNETVCKSEGAITTQ